MPSIKMEHMNERKPTLNCKKDPCSLQGDSSERTEESADVVSSCEEGKYGYYSLTVYEGCSDAVPTDRQSFPVSNFRHVQPFSQLATPL
jgi:hypothetical protein